MKLNYTWVKEWGILIFLWSIIIFRMKHSLFMSFLGITPCSDTPTWREITFQEPEYDDIPDLYWGVTFKVPLDMQSGYRKT